VVRLHVQEYRGVAELDVKVKESHRSWRFAGQQHCDVDRERGGAHTPFRVREEDDLSALRARRRAADRAPQQRQDLGFENRELEGFGQIVIGAV
jgi:hypothetical protein